MNSEFYKVMAEKINSVIQERKDCIKDFPLLHQMVQDEEERRRLYFARINYNLAVYGKSSLIFEDIDYDFT